MPNAYTSSGHVEATLSDRILTLTFDRPEKKNALTQSMYGVLADALAQAAEDDDVRVVLITGAGGTFTAGNDLGDFISDPPQDASSPVFRLLKAASTFPKPLVAAVEGSAVGIGTTLLLHCDVTVVTPTARLQMPFVNLGLVPEAASSLLVPRAVGYARAAEWLLFGDPFSGEDAVQAGLVTETTPSANVMNRARERAEALAAKPPEALRLTKSLLKAATNQPIAHTIRTEAELFLERLQSPEAAEAFSAFFEKRKPDFSRLE